MLERVGILGGIYPFPLVFLTGSASLVGIVLTSDAPEVVPPVVVVFLVFEFTGVRVGGVERMYSDPEPAEGVPSLSGATLLPPAVLTVPPRDGRGPLTIVFLLPPLPPP